MADRPTCPSRTATRARLCPALTWSSTCTACWPPRRAGRGGAVGPAQVLHHQQQRRGGGQLLDHPEQPLEQPPLPGTRHRSTPRPPGRSRPGRAAAGSAPPGPDPRPHPAPPRPAGRPGRAVLGDRYERQTVLVERHVAAAQHPHALPAGDGGQPLDQPGLADSRLPAGHRYQRRAVGGMGQELAQPRQLLGAADERPVETW
jgi:hypothetical protein